MVDGGGVGYCLVIVGHGRGGGGGRHGCEVVLMVVGVKSSLG